MELCLGLPELQSGLLELHLLQECSTVMEMVSANRRHFIKMCTTSTSPFHSSFEVHFTVALKCQLQSSLLMCNHHFMSGSGIHEG